MNTKKKSVTILRMIIRFPVFWCDNPNQSKAFLTGFEIGVFVKVLDARIPIMPARPMPRMSNSPSDICIATAKKYLFLALLPRSA